MVLSACPPASRSKAAAASTRAAAPAPAPAPALFKSVRAALAFAFAMSGHPITARINWSPVPRGGGNARLAGLSTHDRHAQGALIRRAVEERLHGLDLALTLAHHGSGAAREAAIALVCKKVAKLVRKPGLGAALARRHFSRNGVRASQAQLAAQFGLSQQTVSRLDREVADAIDRLRLRAESRLESVFVRTGVADAL